MASASRARVSSNCRSARFFFLSCPRLRLTTKIRVSNISSKREEELTSSAAPVHSRVCTRHHGSPATRTQPPRFSKARRVLPARVPTPLGTGCDYSLLPFTPASGGSRSQPLPLSKCLFKHCFQRSNTTSRLHAACPFSQNGRNSQTSHVAREPGF